MKAVIIDDEKRVCRTISNLVTEEFPEIEIVAFAHNLESGYLAIKEHNPELLFLDIGLPDGIGFDLLRRIENINFKVIFITGHEKYAIEAIKFSALDYLLKPINPEELKKAVNNAINIIKHEEEQVKINTLLDNYNDSKVLKRLILKTSDSIHVVKIEDIIRCEADNNYTFFFTIGNKKILVSKTIKKYVELLKNNGFIRVHQSHLINLLHIEKYIKQEGGYIQMTDESIIPVSNQNRQLVLNELDKLLYR